MVFERVDFLREFGEVMIKIWDRSALIELSIEV